MPRTDARRVSGAIGLGRGPPSSLRRTRSGRRSDAAVAKLVAALSPRAGTIFGIAAGLSHVAAAPEPRYLGAGTGVANALEPAVAIHRGGAARRRAASAARAAAVTTRGGRAARRAARARRARRVIGAARR